MWTCVIVCVAHLPKPAQGELFIGHCMPSTTICLGNYAQSAMEYVILREIGGKSLFHPKKTAFVHPQRSSNRFVTTGFQY